MEREEKHDNDKENQRQSKLPIDDKKEDEGTDNFDQRNEKIDFYSDVITSLPLAGCPVTAGERVVESGLAFC